MPKKTRREKILADLHKKQRLNHLFSSNPQINEPVVVDSATQNPQTYRFDFIKSTRSVPTQSSLHAPGLSAIRRDLTKTIFLALVALACEFFLYWFLELRR